MLDHDGHIPAFATVTDAKTHESRIAQAMELPRGSIVVFDKIIYTVPDKDRRQFEKRSVKYIGINFGRT